MLGSADSKVQQPRYKVASEATKPSTQSSRSLGMLGCRCRPVYNELCSAVTPTPATTEYLATLPNSLLSSCATCCCDMSGAACSNHPTQAISEPDSRWRTEDKTSLNPGRTYRTILLVVKSRPALGSSVSSQIFAGSLQTEFHSQSLSTLLAGAY